MRGFWILLGILTMAAVSGGDNNSTHRTVVHDPEINGQWSYSVDGISSMNVPRYPEKLFHQGNCYYISGNKLMHEYAINGMCQ